MNRLFSPAAWLMGQLRLFPKFCLVSLMFIGPLALVTGILITGMQKTINQADVEQNGLRLIGNIEDLRRALFRHQMVRFMALHGNVAMKARESEARAAVDQSLSSLIAQDHAIPQLDLARSLSEIAKSWNDIKAKQAPGPKDDFTAHERLIALTQSLKNDASNKSGVRLDQEINTHHLALTLLDHVPAVSDAIAILAGRGGSYIDTGLMEPNEELVLASLVSTGKHDLVQLGEQLKTLLASVPEWSGRIGPYANQMNVASAFFERTSNEVLKSVDQTSGEQFSNAGVAAIAEMQKLSGPLSSLLDEQLSQRKQELTTRRNLTLAVIVVVILLASYALAGFYIATKKEIASLSHAVENVALGNLEVRIPFHGNDEIGKLGNAFNRMNDSLCEVIAGIRSSAHLVSLASKEIAQGNADLSERTEAQARSVQRTTASMDLFNDIVRNNADEAARANRLADSASAFATRGGEVVSDIVDTMTAISASSDQIANITGVIDSLAFQTNILALNAAVEAARAGEQGRGFAVVASEVRMLAQRSATAAREIKALIQESTSQVNAGRLKVDGAAQSMSDIGASIAEVAQIISKFASSSMSQRSDIEATSSELAAIESMTQENAALVEQAAAAAESLKIQAHLMAESVAIFKIGSSTVHPDTTAPQAS
ncbi:methyl-accepting chemotaxis protein [Herbaspirillum huttiense]|uniref:methyl-accepting chemotaxis protein n=1 Tax=Herbaspirillum huttiense TaxID=863372 RepID=UPI0012FEE21E|nr:methyl-accepting chemotaxis protein [Herbaspirillum huttiense]